MKKSLIMGTVLISAAGSTLLAAGCSSAPPKENLPSRSEPAVERRVKGDTIVALVNGEPLTWQTVAEKVLELNLKESIDQYLRWKVVDDRRVALGITHTPDELRRRSAAYLDQVKKQIGEERFRQQLAREGVTEEAKRAQVAESPYLAQVFTLDKIVRFAAILEDQVQIDRVYFADEAEARKFREAVTSKGFDAAVQDVPAQRSSARGRFPREAFPKSQPPIDPILDPWVLEAALKLEPGGVTGVETSRSNLYYVVRLLGIRKARAVVYSQVREEVLQSILHDPPSQQEYVRWVEGELVRCRIEYADPATRRERAKGPP
jgi:hypothetical protein